ncbi:flagellar hook-associated protein 2 [Virgibacillus sediminis]|uniref:Flagellar hook-associated protein 2 n=1 Tax=Virgibacillus sediminis TaxID=202260 RepID=A0ABV7A2S3_9BACI
MRIGGLATGMDIDQLVEKLMTTEKMPLDKLNQDKTKLEWQRDGFRDINRKLSELDGMMLDMKMSRTYNSKTVTSSQPSAVTATATTSAMEGSYNIKVTQLATNAINVGGKIDLTADEPLVNHTNLQEGDSVSFQTYDEETKAMKTHTYEIGATDTLKDVLKRISDDDNHVRAFYDAGTNQVVMETTRTGVYNPNGGNEIVFGDESGFDSFFGPILAMGTEREAKDAMFTYNEAYTVESKENSYNLNGITFNFNSPTVGDGATLNVASDTDSAFDNIMKFVDKYNEVIEALGDTQKEERYRDYSPLTDEQKEEMSEKEIELWEEKAKSGILRGESAISNGLFDMRKGWYAAVETGGAYTSLTQIGITTSNNYMDGGKLIVNEEELKAALSKDPGSVQKLFSNSSEGNSRGLVNRLEDAVERTMGKIEDRAGKGSDTLEGYTLGRRMKDLNQRIASFEKRLVQIEDRYWRQFTAMEKAISQMNNQSAMLMSNFGGGQM